MYYSHNLQIIIGIIVLLLLIVALASVIAFVNTNNHHGGGDGEDNHGSGCPFNDDSMIDSMSDCRNQTSTSDCHNDCDKGFDHKRPKGFDGRKHK